MEQSATTNKTGLKYWTALVLGAFLFCYARTIGMHISVWLHSYIYSYGFLVPLVSVYILWCRRDRLKDIEPMPDFLSGISLLAPGLFLLIAGRHMGLVSLQGISLVLSLMGTVVITLGRRFFAATWFPIVYLLFMVPFWDNLTVALHLPLQTFSAMTGATLMGWLGIPVYRDAIYLTLPNITLEVAQVCSGVNNLFAVVAVAVPLAYLALASWRRRILLVCGGVAIAILGNGVRVALVGVLAYHNAAGDLHGPYHILQGLLVSGIGFVGLMFGAWMLAKGETRTARTKTIAASPDGTDPCASSGVLQRMKPSLTTASSLLIIVGCYSNFWIRP